VKADGLEFVTVENIDRVRCISSGSAVVVVDDDDDFRRNGEITFGWMNLSSSLLNRSIHLQHGYNVANENEI
jgi:hypothetical protein